MNHEQFNSSVGYAIALWDSSQKSSNLDFLQLRRAVSGKHGTSGYQSVELMTARSAPTGVVMTNRDLLSSDVWSTGCVFFYVLSQGSHPFGDELMARDARILGKKEPYWDRLEKCAIHLIDVALEDKWSSLLDETTRTIRAMLSHNATSRPSIADLLRRRSFVAFAKPNAKWRQRR